MAMQKFIVELRVDHDDPSKDKIIEDSMRSLALTALTTAMLVADKRKPQIAFSSGNLFEGEKEISLAGEVSQDAIAEDDTPTGRSPNMIKINPAI